MTITFRIYRVLADDYTHIRVNSFESEHKTLKTAKRHCDALNLELNSDIFSVFEVANNGHGQEYKRFKYHTFEND